MKRFLLLMVTSLMVGVVSAQTWQKNIIGIRAGLNESNCSYSLDDAEPKTSFHLGVNYERLLTHSTPIYFETGLLFSIKGCQFNDDYDEVQYTCDAYYMQIPLMLNYKIAIKDVVTIYPSAGFYAAYGIGGKFKYDEMGYEYDVDTFSEEGGLQNFDFGYRLGVSATYKHFVLTIGYEGGISDIADDKAEMEIVGKVKNQNFFISLGYNF